MRSKESFLKHLNTKAQTAIATGVTPVTDDGLITIKIEDYCNLHLRIAQLESAVKKRKKK